MYPCINNALFQTIEIGETLYLKLFDLEANHEIRSWILAPKSCDEQITLINPLSVKLCRELKKLKTRYRRNHSASLSSQK